MLDDVKVLMNEVCDNTACKRRPNDQTLLISIF
jgi:hypothetical protein